MFSVLSDKLQEVFKKIRGYSKVTDENINEIVKHIKLVFLEADVNYKVVKAFVERVKNEAIGREVVHSLTPDKVFVKIIYDALVELLGGNIDTEPIHFSSKSPTTIMLVGLQGSGKTTTAGKLAHYFKNKNKKVVLTAADINRPAAIEQLVVLGQRIGVEVFYNKTASNALAVVREANEFANNHLVDINIVDTAGRLHIDDDLMNELVNMKELLKPDEILFVADSMVGQDAVNQAEQFNQLLGISGVILTKLDSDARGGAALSIRHITNRPIKFIGVSERLDGLELFYPDRMASRILDMGDIVSLVEKVEDSIAKEDAEKFTKKIKSDGLDFNDMLKQFHMLKKMGSFENVLKLIPGMSKLPKVDMQDSRIKKLEAIILSMTPYERRFPKILNSSRKKRIAYGSGNTVNEVNKLIMQLQQINKMLKTFKGKNGTLNRFDSSIFKNMLSR